jgi:hypothetical protein
MRTPDPPEPGGIPPPFDLPDPDGRIVSLSELHRETLALVVFYRGWW